MSKIEEALKKARAKSTVLSGLNTEKDKPLNDPVISSQARSLVKTASSSLISLMKAEAEAGNDELMKKGIIVPDSGLDKVTESFRYLRTQLLQKSKNENFIVMVSSCGKGVDSTFVSMNMAAAFAFDETKTSLVIDCDIQRKNIEEILELEYEYGLLDFLEDDIEVAEILKDIGIKRLRVIPAGKKQQIESDSFTNTRMKSLLDNLVERYQDRYVILNSPSITSSADASILVELVDYVVLVVPYGQVTGPELEKALSKVDKSKLLGVVLNDVPGWD